MSIYDKPPKLELCEKSPECPDLMTPAGIWLLFCWALWNPRRIEDVFRAIWNKDRANNKDENRDNDENSVVREGGASELERYVKASLFMVNVVSVPLTLVVCLIVWVSLPATSGLLTQFTSVLACSVMTVTVSITICLVLWQADQLAAMPSFCLVGTMIASISFPVWALHGIPGAPRPQWNGIWVIASLAILSGIAFNLFVVLYRREFPKSRVELLMTTMLLGVATAVAMLVFMITLGVRRDTSDMTLIDSLSLLVGLGLSTVLAAISTYRPLNWLYGMFPVGPDVDASQSDGSIIRIPFVTLLPALRLRSELRQWLDMDWEIGLINACCLWKTTTQQGMIIAELLYALEHDGVDEMVERTVGLVKEGSRWGYEDFFSEEQRKAQARAREAEFNYSFWRQRQFSVNTTLSPREVRQKRRIKRLGLITVSESLGAGDDLHIAVAGCWYLQNGYPGLAEQAFQKIEASKVAAELRDVTRALATLTNEEQIADKDSLPIPSPPTKPKRADTWKVIQRFQEILAQIWILRHVRTNNWSAGMLNRLHEELTDISVTSDLPLLERTAFRNIANEWLRDINALKGKLPAPRKLRKFENPFVYAQALQSQNPVIKRSKDLETLKELTSLQNLRPIIIHSARYVGKTSLLRALEDEFNNSVFCLYVDLRLVPAVSASGKKLAFGDLGAPQGNNLNQDGLALALLERLLPDEWLSRLSSDTNHDNPLDHCLHLVDQFLTHAGIDHFVLLLDHSERILNPSISQTDQRQIYDFLWKLSQLQQHVSVIIATFDLTTIIASVPKIDFVDEAYVLHLDWLTDQQTADLLQREQSIFSPHYMPSALLMVKHWTAGHPQLVQLTGHFVTRQFNLRLDGNRQLSPNIRWIHIERTMQDPEFRKIAQVYCRNMLDVVRPLSSNMPLILELTAIRGLDTNINLLAKIVYPKFNITDAVEKLRPQLNLLTRSGLVELDASTAQYRIRGELLRNSV